MNFFVDASVALYFVALGGLLFSYTLEVVRVVQRFRDRRPFRPLQPTGQTLPLVTVQLPICDEYYVVDRLIDACCRLDYPRDRLDIQVLDDSTDDTTDRIARRVREHTAAGVRISHVRRGDRTGFKAGNLRHGLATARGEFLAVFDADFVPDPDFLMQTLGHFREADVGVVQCRIRHLNRDRSLLTRAQAPLGSASPIGSRHVSAGRFINLFQGSAGVIRTTSLRESGGWHTDTLTEDEDTSLRLYLCGWRCVELPLYLAGDELPERMTDFKNRVARCNAGPVQCYRKHIGASLITTTLTPSQRLSLMPALHCPWLSLPCVGLVALSSIPIAILNPALPTVVRLLPSAMVVVMLAVVSLHAHRSALLSTVLIYVGTCFRGGLGVLAGLAGARPAFNRTTKPPAAGAGESLPDRYPIRASWTTFLEGGLALVFLLAIVRAIGTGTLWFVPLHLLGFLSCAVVFLLSIREVSPWRS